MGEPDPAMAGPRVLATDPGKCLPGDGGEWTFGKSSGTAYDDTTVNTYVGGDALYRNHEVEGVQIVKGDATVKKQMGNPNFNMGMATVGSQNRPPVGSMLFGGGGNLTVDKNGDGNATTVWMGVARYNDVGPLLGTYYVPQGPTLVEGSRIESLGRVDQAPSELASFGEQLDDTEHFLNSIAATGTVEVSTDVAGQLVLTGTNDAALEKFTFDAALLDGITSIYLKDVSKTATVILDVQGTDVKFFQGETPNKQWTNSGEYAWFLDGSGPLPAKGASGLPLGSDGNANPQYGSAWAALTQHVLWYFPEASNVQIGLNPEGKSVAGTPDKDLWQLPSVPHGQFVGSIFVPNGSLQSNFSTNGRVYVGKDFTMWGGDPSDLTGRAEGHSFPLILPGYECSGEALGSFAVQKNVENGSGEDASASFAGTTFNVEASWATPAGATASATLPVKADGKIVAGPADLPAGTEVTLREGKVDDAPSGWNHDGFTFSGAGGTTNQDGSYTFVVSKGQIARVTLTNKYLQDGTFSLAKVIEGADESAVPDNSEFKVVASWVDADDVQQSAELVVPADGEFHASEVMLPEGTEVSFSEPVAPQIPGYDWEGVAFDHDSITIVGGEDQSISVTATNTYRELRGGFSLSKELSGIKPDKFPADTNFEVTAKWSVDGQEFTEVYKLPVDGTVVVGPQDLPEGTVVTFTEAKAPTVSGYKWHGVAFSPKTVTIADGADLKVVAKNTYAPDLPVTGASGTTALLVGAFVLIVGGGGAYLVSRRRQA